MTQRLTYLLFLPVIMILSFTPSKPVKNVVTKKVAASACATTFNVQLRSCGANPYFIADYIEVNGTRLDLNLGCSDNNVPVYAGAVAFVTGPSTVTVRAGFGTISYVDIWDHRGVTLDGWVGVWLGNGTNTLNFTADLIGCGESYTIRITVK